MLMALHHLVEDLEVNGLLEDLPGLQRILLCCFVAGLP